jgi:hypothetical protein
MRHLKYVSVLFLSILTVLTSCEKDEIMQINNVEQADSLEEFGILGKWGLQSITINGITDMIVHYDTIKFSADSEIADLKGKFKRRGVGYESNGQFELNKAEETITFTYDDKQIIYGIQISDNYMVFSYSENNASIVEDWRKEE